MTTRPFPTLHPQAGRSIVARVIAAGYRHPPHARPLWLAGVILVFAPLMLLALSWT